MNSSDQGQTALVVKAKCSLEFRVMQVHCKFMFCFDEMLSVKTMKVHVTHHESLLDNLGHVVIPVYKRFRFKMEKVY